MEVLKKEVQRRLANISIGQIIKIVMEQVLV